jgi:DNA polymerase-3 subunit epsilon
MREIVLDTETTGLDPKSGHRIVEIGCLELVNHVPSGETFQCYLNPERDMPSDAFDVHGLSDEFLSDKALFADVADAFLDFIADSPLVIHNARFDIGFVNAELGNIGRDGLEIARAIDTVELARRKQPGAPANLDALCRRFGIDNSSREKHGALLDAELLAEVYLELIGGRQPALGLQRNESHAPAPRRAEPTARPPREHGPSAEELATHAEFVDTLDDPLWRR